MVYARFFAKRVLLFLFPVSEFAIDSDSTRKVFTETVLPCLAVGVGFWSLVCHCH